jgi:pimeloyl-ACP methyl ester carboxylesterase
VIGILDQLGFQEVALVTHDIGNMVGYAFAALFPQRVTKWVVMDVPLPGLIHADCKRVYEQPSPGVCAEADTAHSRITLPSPKPDRIRRPWWE